VLERLKEKYSDGVRVRVETREEWKVVVGKLSSMNFKWHDGTGKLHTNYWGRYKNDSRIHIKYPFNITYGDCGSGVDDDLDVITADEFVSNFDKIKIEAGINGIYKVGEYSIEWIYSECYKVEDDYGEVFLSKKNKSVFTMRIRNAYGIQQLNSILEILGVNAEILAEGEELISISTQSGQTIEISRYEAEKLGFSVK